MPFTSINPATEEIVAEYLTHTLVDVDHALKVASGAFQTWMSMSFAERAEVMTRAANCSRVRCPSSPS